MSERMSQDGTFNLGEQIVLPGLFRRIQLKNTARLATKLNLGEFTDSDGTKSRVFDSGIGDGIHVEVWEQLKPTISRHTIVEIGYDDLDLMPPVVSATRNINYNQRGYEWSVSESFSSTPGSDNSVGLHGINEALRLVARLQALPQPDKRPHSL